MCIPLGDLAGSYSTTAAADTPLNIATRAVPRYYFFKKMRVSLDKRVSLGSASSPRAKRRSSDSVSAKRSRSASLDKAGARQEARAPVLLVPRAPSIDVGAGELASRSDHRRHVLDAVRDPTPCFMHSAGCAVGRSR